MQTSKYRSSQYILISSFLREDWSDPEVLKTCQSLRREAETAPPWKKGKIKPGWFSIHIQTVLLTFSRNTAFTKALQWFWQMNLVEKKLLIGFWMGRGISTGCPGIPWFTGAASPGAGQTQQTPGLSWWALQWHCHRLFSHSCCRFGTSWQTQWGQKGVLGLGFFLFLFVVVV